MDNVPSEQSTAGCHAIEIPWSRRPWLLASVILIATLLAYQSVWRAGFIWDDDHHLTNNPAMTAPNGLHMIWTSLAVSRYYPLTLTSFWLQRRFWGLNPVPYHLVNIALHALNGVLVWLVLRRLQVPAAWLAATLWALHPVNVESVAWITELKNTESGLFFFLAILCFLRFEADGKRHWYGLSLLCGAAALLCKPSTVILPLVLLLCVWWQRKKWAWLKMLRIAPFFALAAGMSVLTIIEQRGQIAREGTAQWKLATTERLAIAGKAGWFYAYKVLWPTHLCFVYPRWNVDARSVSSWLPVAGLVAIGAILWARRGRPWARTGLFGCGYFLAALLPVLGFFDVFYFQYSFVADHFQYLASVGPIALVVSAAALFGEQCGRVGRRVGAAAATVAVLALATLTWKQGRIYHDAETLWWDTLAKNPACWMAHTNLGNILQASGRTSRATEQYEEALRIKPDYAMAHNDLAVALLAAGRTDDATRQLELAVQMKPDLTEALDNLAWLLATRPPTQGGDPARAVELAERSCQKSGYRVAGYLNTLSVAYAASGRFDDAITAAQQALELANAAKQPNLIAEIQARLGSFQSRRGFVGPAGASNGRP